MVIEFIFIMILLHIFDDFVLQQKSLSHLKQRKWWEQTCKYDNVNYDRYKYDYIMALFLHGLSWSIIVHIPIALLNFGNNEAYNLLTSSIIINTLIHSLIDHLKCNSLKLNLIEDQLIHIAQIVTIAIIFCR